jgi:hypothetical protein
MAAARAPSILNSPAPSARVIELFMKKSTAFVLSVVILSMVGIVVTRSRQEPQPEEKSPEAPRKARPDRFRMLPKESRDEVDLLTLIDPAQDAVSGTWRLEAGALISPSQTGYAKLEIPCGPSEEYDLVLSIERLGPKESFVVGLVGAGRQFTTHLDAKLFGKNSKLISPCTTGLRLIDGQAENETVRREPVLAEQGVSEVVCSVRKGGIAVQVNGQQIIDWKGNLARLSLPRQWTVPNKSALFLGTYDCPYRVSRAVLRPL